MVERGNFVAQMVVRFHPSFKNEATLRSFLMSRNCAAPQNCAALGIITVFSWARHRFHAPQASWDRVGFRTVPTRLLPERCA